MPPPDRRTRDRRRVTQGGTFAAADAMARSIAGPGGGQRRLRLIKQRLLRNEAIGRRSRGGRAFDAAKFKTRMDASRNVTADRGAQRGRQSASGGRRSVGSRRTADQTIRSPSGGRGRGLTLPGKALAKFAAGSRGTVAIRRILTRTTGQRQRFSLNPPGRGTSGAGGPRPGASGRVRVGSLSAGDSFLFGAGSMDPHLGRVAGSSVPVNIRNLLGIKSRGPARKTSR